MLSENSQAFISIEINVNLESLCSLFFIFIIVCIGVVIPILLNINDYAHKYFLKLATISRYPVEKCIKLDKYLLLDVKFVVLFFTKIMEKAEI